MPGGSVEASLPYLPCSEARGRNVSKELWKWRDTFMFGNAQGVQPVRKEDFVKVLPRRKDFMKTAGLLSSHVDSVEASPLDSKYILMKTVWNINFRANNGDEVTRKTSAIYVVSTIGDSFEVVFQLDHQDLMKIAQELREQS